MRAIVRTEVVAAVHVSRCGDATEKFRFLYLGGYGYPPAVLGLIAAF
jgi:hypothetical protein